MIAWTSSWPCICWPTHLSPCRTKYSYMDFTFFNSSCFYYFIVASSCSRTGSLNLLAFNMANYALILFSYCYWDWVRWKKYLNSFVLFICAFFKSRHFQTQRLHCKLCWSIRGLDFLGCRVWGGLLGVALGGWDWCVAFWGKRLAGVLRVGWYSKILHIIKLYKYT